MITINTVSATKFSYNGITYHKNFMPFVYGNKIAIVNAYDGCIVLTTAPTHFSQFTVNGSTFTSVADLQVGLLDIIYTRDSLSGGGGSGGTVTSVAFEIGTTGTDLNKTVSDPTTNPLITLNVPTASATNRGVLSSTDWSAFNGKQPSSADLTSIAGLTGTTGLLRKTAANTYTLDTNTYVLASALSAYLPLSGGTLESSGSTNTLNINHSSGSGIALNISKNGNGEGLTIVKGSGSGNAASITGGITLLSELNLTTKLADAHINSATTWNAKIGGSGTTNYIPKFTGASSLGNSQIFENNGNVGIGTTSPSEKLHVVGNALFSGIVQFGSTTGFTTATQGGFFSKGGGNIYVANLLAGSAVTKIFQIQRNDVERFNIGLDGSDNLAFVNSSGLAVMSVTSSGNVGIGTTNPTQRLDVNGLINSTNGISVGGSGVSVVWTGTQAAYDAITTKSSTTIYFIQ
jgi:hypothetical protein